MNRAKKEEKKRGVKHTTKGNMSERDYNEMINAYEEKRKPKFKDVNGVHFGNKNVKPILPK